jgi:hypothetical protein
VGAIPEKVRPDILLKQPIQLKGPINPPLLLTSGQKNLNPLNFYEIIKTSLTVPGSKVQGSRLWFRFAQSILILETN